MPTPPLYAAERALAVVNPYSSNAHRVGRQLDQLDLPVSVIETSPDIRRTQDSLYAAARDGDVIFGGGGDGTVNQIGNILLHAETRERQLNHLPFVPLRGGNANDIARMINGRKTAAQIMRAHRLIKLHPLEITVQYPGGDKAQRWALGYFGVGATAAASGDLDRIKNTSNRLTRAIGFQPVREALAAWRSVAGYPPFTMTDQASGKSEVVSDILALRGDRIAKYGRPHAHLAEPQFELTLSRPGGMRGALIDMLQMQQGRKAGEIVTASCFAVQAEASTLHAQYDGETATIENLSIINVGLSHHAYQTLSTRPSL